MCKTRLSKLTELKKNGFTYVNQCKITSDLNLPSSLNEEDSQILM